MKGTFEWNHPQGFISIPVNFVKSTDYRYKSDIHLVCNECKGRVNQKYQCPTCDKLHSRGDLKYKKDEIHEVVFLAEAEKQYSKSKVEPVIHIEKEIDVKEVLLNVEFIEKQHELTNNDEKYSPVVQKIHQYLMRNNKALIALFGSSGRERAGIVMPISKKLVMVELRAWDLIRPPTQLNLEKIENPVYDALVKYSEDLTTVLYDDFIESVKTGKEPAPQLKKETVAPVIECSFLDA